MWKVLLFLLGISYSYQLCSNATIASTARKYIGSHLWAEDVEKTSFDGKITFHKGEDKCNLFVYDVLTESGCTVPTKTISGRVLPPTADQWGYFGEDIAGWKWFKYGGVNPGNVIALVWKPHGHVGIVSQYNGPNDGLAISVESASGYVREKPDMWSILKSAVRYFRCPAQ